MRSITAPGTRRRMFIHTWKLLDSNFLFALKLHTHIADDDENGEDDRVDAMLVDAGTRPLHSEAERDSSKERPDSVYNRQGSAPGGIFHTGIRMN